MRGIAELRVADASVMPEIPCCNTNAPMLALAERAAEIVREQGLVRGAVQAQVLVPAGGEALYRRRNDPVRHHPVAPPPYEQLRRAPDIVAPPDQGPRHVFPKLPR